MFEQDPAKKQEMIKESLKKSKEKYLSVFNSIIEKNDGKHLLGKTLTWADIVIAHSLSHTAQVLGTSLVADFPSLKSLLDTVYNTPSIKAWVDKRPQTDL